MENKAELMEPEVINKVAVFDKYEAQLVEFEKKFTDIIYDFTDGSQVEQAKQDKKEISKAVKLLDETHKIEKADLLTATRELDGGRKSIKDRFGVLRAGITDQEEAHAQVAILEAAKLHSMVTAIENHAVFDDGVVATLEDLQLRLNMANMIMADDRFGSREADAHMAKAKTIQALEGMIALAEKVEAQRIADELAAKKAQEEREEQIRKDAAAEAEKEKERVIEQAKAEKMAIELQAASDAEQAAEDRINAEKARKEADKLAKEQLKIAEQKAIDDAKAVKVKAENDKQAAIKAEQAKAAKAASDKVEADKKEAARIQKIADAEAAALLAKQKNQKHRAKVHREAKDSFIERGFGNDVARQIIEIIKSGEIKNVTINYG